MGQKKDPTEIAYGFLYFLKKTLGIEGEMAKMSAASGHFYREQKHSGLEGQLFPRCDDVNNPADLERCWLHIIND